MIKQIVHWSDDVFEKIVDEYDENPKKNGAKAFGLGALEGALDLFVIVGAIGYTMAIFDLAKGVFKK